MLDQFVLRRVQMSEILQTGADFTRFISGFRFVELSVVLKALNLQHLCRTELPQFFLT